MKHCMFAGLVCLMTILLFPDKSAGQSTVFSGVVHDSTVRFVEFSQYSEFYEDDWVAGYSQRLEKKDSVYTIKMQVQHPALYLMMVMGKTIQTYIYPGDHVQFTITSEDGEPTFRFTGTHENNYNYAAQVAHIFPYRVNNLPFRKDMPLDSFKQMANDWFKKRMDFLETYHAQHPMSKDYYQYIYNNLQYEYLFDLYKPVSKGYMKYTELPGDYFKNIPAKPNLRQINQLSWLSLNALTNAHMLYNTDSPYTVQHMKQAYKNIMQLPPKTRDYLLANLVGVYSKKQVDSYRDSLLQLIATVEKVVKDSASLSYIQRCKADYTLLHRPISQELLQTTLLTDYGSNKKLTLQEVIDQYKGQPMYISFWASWCGPCRDDHKKGKEAQEYLKGKNVAELFFSMDTKEKIAEWKKAAEEDGITENQFLMDEDFKSKIAAQFSIHYIPRYILLDKDHNLVNTEAARPYQMDELKDQVEKMMMKVVKFE